MKKIDDHLPWRVTDISLRPYKEMWSMNPSIHFDGTTWRCVLRCADYAMPNGATIKSPRAAKDQTHTKNAMVIFDPSSWRPIEIYKMRERDQLPRVSCASDGYEDIRLFVTEQGGLQGVAASLHLARESKSKPRAEQVLITFDAKYDIVDAHPIRGESWSGSPQKNWVPFDRSAEPRFLYSIGHGTMFGRLGALRSEEAAARASLRTRAHPHDPPPRALDRASSRAKENSRERALEERSRARRGHKVLDVSHVEPSRYEDLRGGSQLVRVGDDAWLGIGHEMQLVKDRKCYWHTWYTVDSRGKLRSASPPMKLVTNGIEFAAGLAIDGDRAVVSFGVDDMECRLGETRLSAVLALLKPIS